MYQKNMTAWSILVERIQLLADSFRNLCQKAVFNIVFQDFSKGTPSP